MPKQVFFWSVVGFSLAIGLACVAGALRAWALLVDA